MKKIIMYGPGHGHNIEKWLSFFNERKSVELTFIYYGDVSIFKGKYTNVKFLQIGTVISTCLLNVKEKFDLMIIHGGYSIFQSAILSVFIRYDKLIFVPWGNGFVNYFNGNNFLKKIAASILLTLSDKVAAPDQLMRDIISCYPSAEGKKYNFLWGIAKEYHCDNKNVLLKNFTIDFLESLNDKYFIFWPRSILRLSRFDIGIEAIAELRNRNPDFVEQLKCIIWTGNTVDKEYLKELEERIIVLNLTDVINIVEHPFLPDHDIKSVWLRADLSMNLIENDGFSTQLGESFITKTPLVVNEIEAYSLVKERFGLPLRFTELNPVAIANEIESMIKKDTYDDNDIDMLQNFSKNELDNDLNFSRLLSYYLDK